MVAQPSRGPERKTQGRGARRASVTILSSGVYFKTQVCATWTSDLSAITPSPSSAFGDGHYVVGTDVSAGTWRSSSASGSCYWERQSGFTGDSGTIIANELTQG